MDEVEHRRRRTRAARSGDARDPQEHDAPVDDPASGTPSDGLAAAGATPWGTVTTADARTPDEAAIGATETEPELPGADAEPVQRRGAPSRRTDHHSDRHLPFDAHSAHPIADERDGERGLRGLVGSGATQVSVGAAMRARDAARPSDADMAEAEATLTIVHRGWVPRDPA